MTVGESTKTCAFVVIQALRQLIEAGSTLGAAATIISMG
jgi:hypothetical protein